jgi:hypothetical protein
MKVLSVSTKRHRDSSPDLMVSPSEHQGSRSVLEGQIQEMILPTFLSAWRFNKGK